MNRFKKKPELVGSLLLAFFLLHVSDALAKELRIAVASNFLLPLKALSKNFKESTGHKVVVISGSTGKLYAQSNRERLSIFCWQQTQSDLSFLKKRG